MLQTYSWDFHNPMNIVGSGPEISYRNPYPSLIIIANNLSDTFLTKTTSLRAGVIMIFCALNMGEFRRNLYLKIHMMSFTPSPSKTI